MTTIPEIFGSMVFNDSVMKARLPKETYRSLKQTIKEGKTLDLSVATVVANAMKNWALEKGATHFTHWFQPMTGITAEKHDSFIQPDGDGGVLMEFSGKELVQGEPDASSFPSGGLRATFEARGYTAWDPTSIAFIKEGILCIPTAFCSYAGEALDKKTPLLRSMEAIDTQTQRILKLFGNTTASIKTTVGAEQEYFLIPKELYDRRKDLIFTGRTLFGAMSPKGQELEDHYFGFLKQKVMEYMKDLNEELWKLGISAKTEHNEVAPAQHELAPVDATTNVATDHNQLTMEMMQKIAKRHGMICLLHEKPFAGVNGSGKHNNWSISTAEGQNLLEPGDTPFENAQFLLILCAVIKAVDEHQDLLRISVASAGNDHRLGANEAPPAIVSIFLGEELTGILDAIETDKAYDGKGKTKFEIGVNVLPHFPKDTTDRNRTSPFAFTGNKFEFRMVGSANSIACANIMLNTAVAEAFRVYADKLEGAKDFTGALHDLIQSEIKAHKRIVFNGNGYDDAWVKEAKKRGLLDLRTTPDCLPLLISKSNIKLFKQHKVYTEAEIKSRYEIILENYAKIINIEVLTMIDMVDKEILPAISGYTAQLCETAELKKGLKCAAGYETKTALKLSELSDAIMDNCNALKTGLTELKEISESLEASEFCKDTLIPAMVKLRAVCDEAEGVTASDAWPMPSYGDLLFGVR